MKKLKQSSLFLRLKHFKISINVYTILYKVYNHEEVDESILQKFPEALIKEGKLTDKSIKILNSIDGLFIAQKTIKVEELMGLDYQTKIEEYINIFPTQKLPNGKYARGNKGNIETNFKWFFTSYNYTWDVIHKATSLYVNEYKAENYMYMRTALYFIRKDDGTRNVLSDLANYCDRIISGDDYIEDKHFKTNVI